MKWCLAAAALAVTSLGAPAAGRADPPARPVAASTAIGRVADTLASQLGGAIPAGSIVVAAPLVSDAPAPRGAELATRLAALVAGRRGVAAAPAALTFEAARTAARAHPALVFVRPTIEGGKLRATADVVPTPRSRWARLRDPTPTPVAHAYAEAHIDAEVRSHLAPIPLTALAPVRARAFESGVVAAACADLDGDGAPEIVTVSRTRVVLLRLRGGKVAPIHARTWADLAPVAPAPLREPIGFAIAVPASPSATDPDGSRRDVVVSLTDRAESLRLDARLEVTERYPRLAMPDGDGVACAGILQLTVSGPLERCRDGAPPPGASSVGGRFDAYASVRLSGPGGRASRISAGREDGVLELRDDRGRTTRIAGAGAQLAVGDLDQDGVVEILASLDVADPIGDAVVIRSWPPGGAPREVFRMPAGAGVHALAVCPPDGPGRQAFVVATGDAVTVVR